ncbi:MAG: hypothetical protein ACRELB_13925, partial [Polyangiaceae bacterium]
MALATGSAARAGDLATSPTATGKIVRIEVTTENVFDLTRNDNVIFQLADALHIVTHPIVVRRLLLFDEGQPLDSEALAETERNLRAFDPLRAASITATARPDGGYDVSVRTQDRWTLRFGAGLALAGGVTKASLDVGDSNFLGFGKDLGLSLRVEPRNVQYGAAYFDPDIGGSRVQMNLSVVQSDLLKSLAGSLGRPFFARETPYAWAASLLDEGAQIQYFQDGHVSAEIHRYRQSAVLSGGLGTGPREDVRRLSLGLALERALYEAPTGADPD